MIGSAPLAERPHRVRRVLHRLVASLGVFAIGCSTPAAWAAEERALARIIVLPLHDQARAAFQLSKPTTSFQFAEEVDAIRSRTWALKTPGLTLHHGVITADNGASFREFQIVINPDEAAVDRVYPALSRVGPDGLVLYTPYLEADTRAYETIVELKLPPRDIAVSGSQPEMGVFGGVGVDRYVFLGPRDYVRENVATFVTPPDLPPWIGTLVQDKLVAILKLYQTKLRRALPEPPTVITTYAHTNKAGSYSGNVSAGRIMALRFQGQGWQDQESDDTYTITHLIAHEAFHFWNGHLFAPRSWRRRNWGC